MSRFNDSVDFAFLNGIASIFEDAKKWDMTHIVLKGGSMLSYDLRNCAIGDNGGALKIVSEDGDVFYIKINEIIAVGNRKMTYL